MLVNYFIKRQFNFLRVLIMIDLKILIEGGANKQLGGGKILVKVIDGGCRLLDTLDYTKMMILVGFSCDDDLI